MRLGILLISPTLYSARRLKLNAGKLLRPGFYAWRLVTAITKCFSLDTELGVNQISTALPLFNGPFNGLNFWGTLFSSFNTAGFDCTPTGNAAADFICMAAGQGGSFMSFKLNEATGITNKTTTECYTGGALTATVLGCGDALGYGGQARDVSCNMLKGSSTQAACVAIYNRNLNIRAARLFIATTSTATPTFCPANTTSLPNTCLVTPVASGGDSLKLQDGITPLTNLNMGDVLNFSCRANLTGSNFNCFIGGLGAGSAVSGFIGLYNFTTTAFATTAAQSLLPLGGVFMPSCTSLDEKKYYCLFSGTGAGSACGSGNNCTYGVWNNYQTKLNSGLYSAWPVDTAWSYFSIAK